MTIPITLPATYNVKVRQGSTFLFPISWKIDAVPVPGVTKARMQVRKKVKDATALISFDESNGIAINSAAGEFTVSATAVDMAAVPAGTWGYDIEVEDAEGVVTGLLTGTFTVLPEWTRD